MCTGTVSRKDTTITASTEEITEVQALLREGKKCPKQEDDQQDRGEGNQKAKEQPPFPDQSKNRRKDLQFLEEEASLSNES